MTQAVPSLTVRSLIFAAAATLLAAPNASAHIRSGAVAVDYRTRVSALPMRLRGVIEVRIYESDRAVHLSVAPGHTVVVLGYLREPFVRVTSAGVEVKPSAPTAGAAGLVTGVRPHSVGWKSLSRKRSVTWHDNRVRALAPGIDRANWTVPLIVDGDPTSIQGELLRLEEPPLWPWLVFGAPFVLVALLVYFRRRSAVPMTAALFGVVAAAGLVASGAGFAFETYASAGKWVELGNELAFVVVGVAVIARGSRSMRGIAGASLGLLALAVGAMTFSVLLHPVALSVFPATGARALVALTIWSGMAAAGLGLVVFEALLNPRRAVNRQ